VSAAAVVAAAVIAAAAIEKCAIEKFVTIRGSVAGGVAGAWPAMARGHAAEPVAHLWEAL
jgi:hypothetical protein